VLEHYRDDHCVDHFAVETKTIIRTKDSRENGAVFLNETEVTEKKCTSRLCFSCSATSKVQKRILKVTNNYFIAL
jgi:hypothetical protein